jgi:hypothetical protein
MFQLRTQALIVVLAGAALTGGVALAAPDAADPVELPAPISLYNIPAAEDSGLLLHRSAVLARIQVRDALARQAAADQAAFEAFTMDSDMRGIQPSRYTGTFFRPALEDRRRCIVKRESEGHYDVISAGGGYFGAYQMSPELGRGATWMMLPEHKELLGADRAKAILAELRETPVNEWPRYWQDAAFSTVHNWEGTGSGASHWRGGRWSC